MAVKSYPTLAEAKDFIVKILAEKRNKGYEDKVKDAIPDRSHLVPNVAPQRATAVQATNVEEDNKGAAKGASRTVYLECKEGSSNKFYELFLFTTGKVAVYTRYGRIGTSGMESEKSYPSVTEATEFYESTLAEKLKKGYKVKGNQGDDGDYHRGVIVVEAAAAESKPKGGRKAKASKEEEPPVEEETKPAAKTTGRGKKAAATKKEDEDITHEAEAEAVEEAAPKGRKRKATAITSTSAEAKTVSAPDSKASSTEAGQKVYLECVEGNSSKFYEMSLVNDGANYSVNSRYGRIGSDGSTTSKSFDTFDKANALYAKLLKEKQAKGYK
jgi:predicted DNA-binding WGR domain protein